MSIPVAMEQLRSESGRFRLAPYLLTVSEDGRPHAVAVAAAWDGAALVAAVGKRTAANVAARPQVSLLWPPNEPGGYSLIVDGAAELASDGSRVAIAPTRGVLHRSAAGAAAGETGCSDDCVPILR